MQQLKSQIFWRTFGTCSAPLFAAYPGKRDGGHKKTSPPKAEDVLKKLFLIQILLISRHELLVQTRRLRVCTIR
jgi:hypothetical protein